MLLCVYIKAIKYYKTNDFKPFKPCSCFYRLQVSLKCIEQTETMHCFVLFLVCFYGEYIFMLALIYN